MKFDHLIHPTDFSESALNALRFAAEIARRKNSTLHLIHIFEKPYYTVASGSGGMGLAVDTAAERQLIEEINVNIHKLAELDFVKGLNVMRRLVPDVPTWKFFEHVNPNEADLVVMGTRGATGLLHGGLLGTNTERVIRHATMPVFSVPVECSWHDVKRIMFATDFRDPLGGTFGNVLELAKLFDAELHVVNINTRDAFTATRAAMIAYDDLAKAFDYKKMRLTVHNAETVEEGIMDVVAAYSIDVVAMLTHGRTGVAHLLRGSIAEDVSANLKTPLLTFKNQ